MPKPKHSSSPATPIDPGTWWSLAMDRRTGVIALAFHDGTRPDGDQVMLAAVDEDGEGVPAVTVLHPSQAEGITRMAVVDQAWTDRARDSAAQVIDARRRLANIEPTVAALVAQATELHSQLDALADPAVANPTIAARHILEGLASLTAALQPTKDGIVWR